MIGLVPSLLSADPARLGEQVREAEAAGAYRLQVDVMDGHFVPAITVGPLMVEAVRRCTKLPIEAHLMISNPGEYIEDFAKAGADIIIVHQESSPHLHRLIQQIQASGKMAGVALLPSTPVSMLEEILPVLDMVVVMTVNPAFEGQKFLPKTLSKIAHVRRLISEWNLKCDIEADGRIDATTIRQAVVAGANLLVAGSAVYNKDESVATAMERLLKAM